MSTDLLLLLLLCGLEFATIDADVGAQSCHGVVSVPAGHGPALMLLLLLSPLLLRHAVNTAAGVNVTVAAAAAAVHVIVAAAAAAVHVAPVVAASAEWLC